MQKDYPSLLGNLIFTRTDSSNECSSGKFNGLLLLHLSCSYIFCVLGFWVGFFSSLYLIQAAQYNWQNVSSLVFFSIQLMC